VTAYFMDAGLLMIPMAVLFVQAARNRREVPDAQRLLWIWAFTLFLVFSLPTQRSARYVLPAMPGLAVLCALNWDRISRKAFVASLIAAGLVIALLAYLSIRLQIALPGAGPYSLWYWMLLAGAGMVILGAIFVPRWTRAAASVGVITVYLSFAAFMRPFDGLLGRYGPDVQQEAKAKEIWVPFTWMGMGEEYRLLLPGANLHGYAYQSGQTIPELSARFPCFAIRLPMQETNLPPGVRVIGRRLDFGSRHTARQIKEMIQGQVFQHLFLQELLIENTAAGAPPSLHADIGAPH
jgi:4-amino-4-deoxy-L-arabinose transferase-like glycosyltransferase